MAPVDEIRKLIQKYFDALYEGDADLFAEIFHPEARLYSMTETTPIILDVPAYLDIVRKRVSPKSRGDRREDEIVAIEVPTATTAHVRVRELFLPKHFTDELTLVFSEGKWRIVAKVWHFTLVA